MRRRGGIPDNDYMSDQRVVKQQAIKEKLARFDKEGKAMCSQCGGVFDKRGFINHKRFCKGI